MKILGIENRDENWRTARYFAPFFEDAYARLHLAQRLGEPAATQASEVELTLFWTGVRDYFCPDDVKERKGYYKIAKANHKQRFAQLYRNCFVRKLDLRAEVMASDLSSGMGTGNYGLPDEKREENLFNNLFYTEIDVVLKTPKHLFIGEAKHETGFDSFDTKHVLVHQLVRQNVTAKILLSLLKCEKEVVQFVIADDKEQAKNFGQVRFLIDQKWMNDKNILTWEQIKELWP